MAVVSLILESVRWVLQGKFPALKHPAAPTAPEWIRLYYVIQYVFFGAASCAAGSNVINAVRTRDWRRIEVVGWLLYLAWWLEVFWAGGYFSNLAH